MVRAPIARTAVRLLSLVLAAAANASAAAPLPLLRITDISAATGLEGSTAADINNRGEVLATRPDGSTFLWKAGGSPHTILHSEGYRLAPRDLNDEGVVVGNAYDPGSSDGTFVPFSWTAAGGLKLIRLPGTLGGGLVQGINNRGQIVGQAKVPVGEQPYLHALVGSVDKGLGDPNPERQSHSAAYAVNNLGFAGGYSAPLSAKWQQHAVLIDRRGRLTPLGTLATPGESDNSKVLALNDADAAVGYSTRHGMPLAFYWSKASGMVPLKADTPDRNDWSMAIGINRHGQVVATYGSVTADGNYWEADAYWDAEHGFVDLKTLIDPADPLKAVTEFTGTGASINDRGEIVANAWVNRQLTGVLLTPLRP